MNLASLDCRAQDIRTINGEEYAESVPNGNYGSDRNFGQCASLNCGSSKELPALKTGGRYKTNCESAFRFCRGLSVPFTMNQALQDSRGRFLSN